MYRNPVPLVSEWQRDLNRGKYSSLRWIDQKERFLYSPSYPNWKSFKAFKAFSKSTRSNFIFSVATILTIITKRKLRSIINLTAKEQRKWTNFILVIDSLWFIGVLASYTRLEWNGAI